MDDTTQGRPTPAKRPTTVERRSDTEVVVTRALDAPAHLVFAAWSDPELFRRWWVPRSMGMTLESCEMDVRTGGTYRLGFGGDMVFHGRYLEVVPASRIVWTNEEGEHGSVTTVTFTETDGTTVLVISEVFPSKEALDAEGGAADALHETLAQLDEVLVELASMS